MKQSTLLKSRAGGQALVELAIVLPLLIILCMGAVDFGRLYYHFIAVESAAAAGAQYGCASTGRAGSANGIREAALAQAFDINNRPTVVTSAVTGGVLNVTVSAMFSTLVPWPGMPHNVNVTRTARARILR
jgi:Flp pilus assembly protein TadG